MNHCPNIPVRCSFCHGGNFGDLLGPYLYHAVTQTVPDLLNINDDTSATKKHYMICGSIMRHANNKSIVWGIGYMAQNEKNHLKEKRPLRICAVRGTKTKNKFQRQIPTIGDPGLLLPIFYPVPEVPLKKFTCIGLVPHATEYDYLKQKYVSSSGKNMYNVIGLGNLGFNFDVFKQRIENILIEISRCDVIITSSLHGIITAHAYNIPVIWSNFTNITKTQKLGTNHYKFHDYFSSIQVDDINLYKTPIPFDKLIGKRSKEQLQQYFIPAAPDKIKSIQSNLIKSCPFLYHSL